MELKFSNHLSAILNFARQEALRTGSYGISPDHLFLAILRHGDNSAYATLCGLGVDTEDFKQFIDNRIFTNESIPYSDIENISLSNAAMHILHHTALEAIKSGYRTLHSFHLLLSLAENAKGFGTSYLGEKLIDYATVHDFLKVTGDLDGPDPDDDWDDEDEDQDEESNGGKSGHGSNEGKAGSDRSGHGGLWGGMRNEGETGAEGAQEGESVLEECTSDITRAVMCGDTDPVVGRDAEIERVLQILCRRKKNNPILVGDPGVGKSAIIYGIAKRILDKKVPEDLFGKRILSLDIASVVAGTRFRGDFEKRLKSIIKELSTSPDTILFIDEFHTIVGAGGGSGSLDAANILKPALARGEIQCIGATTFDEFTKVVEKDAALNRRFQKVVVEPTDQAQTVAILKEIKDIYETHHNVSFTDEAIKACVRMSERYITDRCLPDKAIDVFDEAGSMVHLRHSKKKGVPRVTQEDIATVISKITGIPAGHVAESENDRLLKMDSVIKSRVIGQDEAVETVTGAIRRNRAGIRDPHRPIGTFLFFGPTGVGKTQLAKVLSEYLFDSEDSMIRVDMSEYMEKFNVSRLIGAPPGYVGYEDGGQLSEKVRRKPYSVVLLDEIEKAHPDVFNLLLQIMDEGRLTDSNGRLIDFRNTVLVMTSNAGSRETEEYGSGVGFRTSEKNADATRKSIVEKNIKRIFPPEFLGRVDEQVFFNSLTREDIEKIVDIEVKELSERMESSGFRLQVSPAARKLVAGLGYDPKFGARPLRRAVRKYIEDPVSEYIISQKLLADKTPETMVLKVGISDDRRSTRVYSGNRGGSRVSGNKGGSGSLDSDEFESHLVDHVDEFAH